MDYIDNGNMPLVAYFIPDGTNLQSRVPFKCRIVSETTQFYTSNLGGLIDIGTAATIITNKQFAFNTNCKVILNDILYSVASITPFVPDQVMQGYIKPRVLSQYMIQLQ